jgi:hypothetical protein
VARSSFETHYGLRYITQKHRRTGSNFLITLSGSLEREVHRYTGSRALLCFDSIETVARKNRLNSPDAVEALNAAAFGPKADTEKHASN